jgi:hypothetical protein
VAKTRKRATKKTSARRGGARRSTRTKKARSIVAKPGHVELRPIRTKLKADVETLSTAISQASVPRPELEEALKRMSRFLADIQDICGPDMSIPIS